jgi:C1A family cysteine protease
MTHEFGYIPSKPDRRDFKFETISNKPLPASVDLRVGNWVSPIRDQADLGACTGFAETALREHLDLKAGKPLTVLSPLFLYYREREIEHTISQDAGAEPRDGFKTLLHSGVAPETDEPYNVNDFTHAPSPQATKDALKFKISSYRRMRSLRTLKSCLASGYGAVLGFTVYSSFEEDEKLATRGIMPMPAPGEQVLGGHAVFCCGYSDPDQWLIIKNSWGDSWGLGGFFYMPYAFVTSVNCSDIWTAGL